MGAHSGRRALVVHGSFENFGGAEVYAARIISILQEEFAAVEVLHYGKAPDLAKVREYCGVTIDPNVVRFQETPRWPGLGRGRFSLLHYARVVRQARRVAKDFDLVVATFAECPLNAPRAIQTLHIPLLVTDEESLSYCGIHYSSSARRVLHGAYIAAVKVVMGFTRRGMEKPLTIANSHWTAAQVRRHYPTANIRAEHFGVDVGLTSTSTEWRPFAEREDNLVIIGRVVPEKRLDDAIEIVERLRASGRSVGLVVIGGADAANAEAFTRDTEDKPWIIWRRDLSRKALEAQVAAQKWGLHCYRFEHYGFAPAELQALGCIPFIHDSGGQVEVVENPAQRYQDIEDAVAKIAAMLDSPERQLQALSTGLRSAQHHRTTAFRERFRAILRRLETE